MEHVEQPPAEQPPRLRIGFAAEFYHVYLTPLMRSKRGTLTLDGLPRLPAEDDAMVLLERFRAALSKRQLDGSGRATQRATLSLLWPRFQLSISLWMLVGLATDGAQPFLIATLVRELRTGTGSVGTRLGIVAAIGALCLVNTASLLVIQSRSSLFMKSLVIVRNVGLVVWGVVMHNELVSLVESIGYTVALLSFAWYNHERQLAGKAPSRPLLPVSEKASSADGSKGAAALPQGRFKSCSASWHIIPP